MERKNEKELFYTVDRLACFSKHNYFFYFKGADSMKTDIAFQIEEPLLIQGKTENSYSLLPTGTVLYFDKDWPEGHTTYYVYFNVKSEFKSTPVNSKITSPIWLRNIESDELAKLVSDYPISREELTAILKAKRATKQDIVQILRDWQD
jgi:hypothetical protein